MQFALQIGGLFFIVGAFVSVLRQPLTPNRRFWITAQFLLAGILFWTSEGFQIQAAADARFGATKLDAKSVTATFNSISEEGPERQLVFHYTLANTTAHPFQIGKTACSMVSFRFSKKPATTLNTRQPNPALSTLEKDPSAYRQFTGQERLPTKNPALSLDQCPLELQPKERRAVAIAIPYAYPETAGTNPSADDLRTYVRDFMPQIDGFGLSDPAQHYAIVFPRTW